MHTAERRRGRPSLVTPSQIVDAAAGLAGDELTVSEVARRLDVVPGTIYRYFPDREALVTAVLDQALERAQKPKLVEGRWRDYLHGYADMIFTVLTTNPALLESRLWARPSAATRLLTFVEPAADHLLGLGVDIDAVLHTHNSVNAIVRLAAEAEVHYQPDDQAPPPTPTAGAYRSALAAVQSRSAQELMHGQLEGVLDGLSQRIPSARP